MCRRKSRVALLQSETSRPAAICLRWENPAACKAADVSERKTGKKKEDIISLKLRVEQMLIVRRRADWIQKILQQRFAAFKLVR